MDMTAKIAALLAKAEATEFPEEAEALRNRATDLMVKHQIAEAEVRGIDPHANAKSRIEKRSYAVPNTAQRGRARVQAINELIIALGGKAVVTFATRSKVNNLMTVVATVSTLDMLDILIPSVIRQMEYHTKKASRDYVKRLKDYYVNSQVVYAEAAKFRASYTIGFGMGVAKQITESREAESDSAGALVLVGDRKRVDEYYAQEYSHARKGRKSRREVVGGALNQGYRQGQNANVGRAEVSV